MPWKLRWAQLRRRTDTGRTRDKVAHPDPAAAPLGTDEESGGAGTPEEEIAKSVERETPEDDPEPASSHRHSRSRPDRG